MCGRFYVETEDTPEELMRLLRQLNRGEPEESPDAWLGEKTPGMPACVVARSRGTGGLRPFAMRWGFPMEKKLVINARLETAAEKPLFRDSFRQRRCLIPASGWFEWDHREKKPPKYRFHSRSQRWIWLAGLYRLTSDQMPVFAVVTRPAEGALSAFHDRMPLWFPPDGEAAWLGEAVDAFPEAGAVSDLSWARVPPAGQGPVQLGLFDDSGM